MATKTSILFQMKKVKIFIASPQDDIDQDGIIEAYKYNYEGPNNFVKSNKPIWEFLDSKQFFEMIFRDTILELSQKDFDENFDIIQ